MSFPKYPRYKNSGVEWLGEVPEDWEIAPMKLLATLKGRLGWQNLRADEYTEEGPYLVTSEHLVQDRVAWDHCYHVTNERYAMAPEIQLRAGDLLMMKDGAAMGKLGYVDELPGEACLNSHLLLFRPRDKRVTNRFLYYVLGSPAFAVYMGRERTGSTFFGISQQSIGNFSLAVPPACVVNDIVRFLDRETAKIDALIAEQQRLIELLKEKRQAVISHAVTRGLDPDASMRPSGVEWLGHVPAHWEVKSFQRCVAIAEGQVDPEAAPYADLPLIAPNHIESGTGRLVEVTSAAEQGAESGKYLCERGDVIYSKIRPALRKACIAPAQSLCSADMYPLRGMHGLLNAFLFWYLLSEPFSALAVLESERVAMPKINRESLKPVQLPVPPPAEQEQIVAYLCVETMKLDELSAEAEKAILLLQERRTALISAAVTGKIDVRGIAQAEAA
jgi:type I restriction enzyme, S subunit